MIEMGFHLICYGVDSAVLRDSLAAGAQAIRATAKPLA